MSVAFKVRTRTNPKEPRDKAEYTDAVELLVPADIDTPAKLAAKFGEDGEKFATDIYISGLIVKLQTHLRNSIEPKDWNLKALQKALAEFTPKERRAPKTKAQKWAEEFGISEQEAQRMIDKALATAKSA